MLAESLLVLVVLGMFAAAVVLVPLILVWWCGSVVDGVVGVVGHGAGRPLAAGAPASPA